MTISNPYSPGGKGKEKQEGAGFSKNSQHQEICHGKLRHM